MKICNEQIIFESSCLRTHTIANDKIGVELVKALTTRKKKKLWYKSYQNKKKQPNCISKDAKRTKQPASYLDCILIWLVMFLFLVVHTHSHVLCVFAVSSTNQSNICTNWQFNEIAAHYPNPKQSHGEARWEKLLTAKMRKKREKMCCIAISPVQLELLIRTLFHSFRSLKNVQQNWIWKHAIVIKITPWLSYTVVVETVTIFTFHKLMTSTGFQ